MDTTSPRMEHARPTAGYIARIASRQGSVRSASLGISSMPRILVWWIAAPLSKVSVLPARTCSTVPLARTVTFPYTTA